MQRAHCAEGEDHVESCFTRLSTMAVCFPVEEHVLMELKLLKHDF